MDIWIIITTPGNEHLIDKPVFYQKEAGDYAYENAIVYLEQLEKKYPNVYFSIRRLIEEVA